MGPSAGPFRPTWIVVCANRPALGSKSSPRVHGRLTGDNGYAEVEPTLDCLGVDRLPSRFGPVGRLVPFEQKVPTPLNNAGESLERRRRNRSKRKSADSSRAGWNCGTISRTSRTGRRYSRTRKSTLGSPKTSSPNSPTSCPPACMILASPSNGIGSRSVSCWIEGQQVPSSPWKCGPRSRPTTRSP